MNNVILMGRLVAEPEIRYAQNGAEQRCVARYRIAVDRRQSKAAAQNGQPTADFISCVAFGQRGEFAQKYLHKGMRMLVRGSIRTGSYQNKNGQTVYTTDIIVDDQEFADSKNSQTSSGQSYNNNAPAAPVNNSYGQNKSYGNRNRGNSATAQQNNNQNSFFMDEEGFMSIPDGVEDEGLPFN